MDQPLKLHELVSILRKRRGLTQVELAVASQVSTNTISRLEQGLIEDLRSQTVARMAEALGVSTDVLVGRAPLPAEEEPAVKRPGRGRRKKVVEADTEEEMTYALAGAA